MKVSIILLLGLSMIVLSDGVLIGRPVEPALEGIHRHRTPSNKWGGLVEYDIRIPGPHGNTLGRALAYNAANKWPNGIVPYDLSRITDSYHRQLIEYAMNVVMYDTGSPIAGSDLRNTCVYFRPRQSSDRTYLTIQYGVGCNAHLGYWANYGLTMNLQHDSQGDCFYSATIQHELLHVLGFDHEHSRPDRDNYVQINYANIDPEWHFAFEKNSYGSTAINQGTSYDYRSIMHYHAYAFSNNGRPTITPKQANVQLSNDQGLTPTDVLEVRLFYGCSA